MAAQRTGRQRIEAIIARAAYLHGKTFAACVAQGYQYEKNNGAMAPYAGKDFDYDLEQGYIEIRTKCCTTCAKCNKPAAQAHEVHNTRALFPRGFGDPKGRQQTAPRDRDKFDMDAVNAFDTCLNTEMYDEDEKHVDICAGTMSHLLAHLERNPFAQGLAIDILTESRMEELTEGVDPSVLERIQYVKLDVVGLTWRQFQNVVRDHLACKPSQLASVHFSPPCTTYTRAHHGKNPHRSGSNDAKCQSCNQVHESDEEVHRVGLTPVSDTARKHDRLNESVLDTLRQLSNHAHKTVISVENPVGLYREMPFVKRLLGARGWFMRTADHCMHRRNDEGLFPNKRTTWLLYNVNTEVPLQKCNGSCGCCLPGTKLHKLLVVNRTDKVRGQSVMKCPTQMGKIPKGLFDILQAHRCKSMKDRTKPQDYKPLPIEPLNEVLVDTGKTRDPTVSARC